MNQGPDPDSDADTPDFPALKKDPTKDLCCHDITLQCRGNTKTTDDFKCTKTGWKDKDDVLEQSYAKDDDEAAKLDACCVAKTCDDFVCATVTMAQVPPADPPDFGAEAKNPGKTDCCTDIVDQCYGNTDVANDVKCPDDHIRVQGNFDSEIEDAKLLTIDKLSNCCK